MEPKKLVGVLFIIVGLLGLVGTCGYLYISEWHFRVHHHKDKPLPQVNAQMCVVDSDDFIIITTLSPAAYHDNGTNYVRFTKQPMKPSQFYFICWLICTGFSHTVPASNHVAIILWLVLQAILTWKFLTKGVNVFKETEQVDKVDPKSE